ncbi:hypothetical protein DER46DRAFT_637329 [Fusarium sp. MPI-SDFR-AT-0072]|nr:hypothetical protein DER46DRAFT_637329 [Fusarium sp. MPI-SDFR-AT-0072]
MAGYWGPKPTQSPYASGPYDDSSHPLSELWLDNITLDAGHVIIHYLVTGTYQCLQSQEEEEEGEEKKFSAELATAIRVYVAADSLSLPALREMAREEIFRLGEWLSLLTLIKVMEEAALSFDAYPGIAAYVESRVLLHSQDKGNHGPEKADETLDALGTPDSLSKVLLRSVLLAKASEGRQRKEPNYQVSTLGFAALELRLTEEAMERAETRALRTAEAAGEEQELGPLMEKNKTGGLKRGEWARVQTFKRNNIKRDQEQSMERALDARRGLERNKSSAQQPILEENHGDVSSKPMLIDTVAKARRVASDPFRTSPEDLETEYFERPDHYNNEIDNNQSLTTQLTPGSSDGSSVYRVSPWW